jgi:hypothetical protein
MDLMLGYQKYVARHTLPGFATALFANSARMVQQNGFVITRRCSRRPPPFRFLGLDSSRGAAAAAELDC